MSVSGSSEKLNDCETCENIKNNNSSNYSSDCEDATSFSESNSDRFRLNFEANNPVKSKGSSRKPAAAQVNKTFSSEKIREIERRNAMLVDKILYHNRRPNRYIPTADASFPKATSSAINRRRHQEKISRENEILLKKIQSVKPAVRYT